MTLKEVAKEAGVSHTTVSLVVNKAEGSRVSQRTRERVFKAIKKLDYNPNLTAKRLASGKTNSIGLYTPFEIPIFRNYTFMEMITGIQDVLSEKGFDLVLFSGGRKLYRNRPVSQIVKQNTVDGLIIFNTRYTSQKFVNNYIKSLNQQKFHYVIINYYWGNAKINYVGIDYEADAFNAAKYLTDLGHRKIALIAGTQEATVNARVIRGYKRALKDIKISIDKAIIEYADYDYQLAYEKTLKIINNNPTVTSFFIGGFEMAPACLKAIKYLGLNVPEDFSIICYIDNEIMPLLDPPITSISWPYYEMGKKAAELLIENSKDKKRVLFDTDLIIRGSTSKRS
ncbi:MAG: LacI family DNA-binding transcriptional regulator [Planctomycetota bacterium]|jgi:DNA-binding LacI/PurR family transcriptional regulator